MCCLVNLKFTCGHKMNIQTEACPNARTCTQRTVTVRDRLMTTRCPSCYIIDGYTVPTDLVNILRNIRSGVLPPDTPSTTSTVGRAPPTTTYSGASSTKSAAPGSRLACIIRSNRSAASRNSSLPRALSFEESRQGRGSHSRPPDICPVGHQEYPVSGNSLPLIMEHPILAGRIGSIRRQSGIYQQTLNGLTMIFHPRSLRNSSIHASAPSQASHTDRLAIISRHRTNEIPGHRMHGALTQSPRIPDLFNDVPLQLPGIEMMPYGGRGLTITSTVAGIPVALGVGNGGWSSNSGVMVQEIPLTRAVGESGRLEHQAREHTTAAVQIGRTPGVAAPWSGRPRPGCDLDVDQVE